MLNLKKGLALVLAAATAFTFAPVTSFAAVTANDDGLTTTSGIDSLDSTSLTLKAGASQEIFLKEHNDKSSGTDVKAFRITETKVEDKKTAGSYGNLVTFKGENNKANRNLAFNSDVTGSAVTDDTTWGNGKTDTSVKQYIVNVENMAGKPDTTASGAENARTTYHVNGAYVTFTAESAANVAKLKSNKTTIKIDALGENSATAPALDSTTLTVTVTTDGVNLEVQAPDQYVGEDETVKVPFRITNNNVNGLGKISELYTTYDPYTDQEGKASDIVNAYVSNYTPDNGTEVKNSGNSIAYTNLASGKNITGTLVVKALKAGTVTVTLNGKGTDAEGKASDSVRSASFKIVVTPGNGKLRVTYTRAYDGQTVTYTDDAETQDRPTSGINRYKSITSKVENGKWTNKAVLIDAQRDNPTTYEHTATASYETEAHYGNASEAGEGLLPAAQTLVNGGTTEFDIAASSDVAGAEISYDIVAPVSFTDNIVNSKVTPSYSSSKKSDYAATYDYNALTGKYSGTPDGYTNNITDTATQKIASDLADGDYYTYTTAAAEKYGAVDKNGHVTLKSSAVQVPLYVIVTVKSADKTDKTAARKASTYVIPVNTADVAPLQFYAGANDGYTEIDEDEITNTTRNAKTYKNHKLYLNLTDKTSDTIQIATNAGSSYVTGTSSDDSVATYSNGVVTAHKAGTCNIVLKTTSSPSVSGLIIATIPVEVNSDKSTNTLALDQNTVVTKETSRSQVKTASVGVAGSQVIYDTDNLYTPDNTRPNKFRRIKSKESGYGDITVSSSGYVTYNHNAGTVYVRAYAKADGYNPTGYVYAKVVYGSQDLGAVDNTLTVDKKSVVVKPGETVTINATSNTGITVASADTSIATATNTATVATSAAITVTGVKQGTTTIKVSAAADTKSNVKSAEIEIPVVVTDANGNVADDVKTPAKVTGVKVKNKKGGKVTVTWKKQNQKNIKYYVKKTVGKKSSGKSVNGGKTTLFVKKGATVKVKVKAYIYNASGKKLVGKYSKTVTLKTDKK